MVYFFHHYEIPAVVQMSTVHHVEATVNIHEHQRAPERRADQQDRSTSVSGAVQPMTNAAVPSNDSQVDLIIMYLSYC